MLADLPTEECLCECLLHTGRKRVVIVFNSLSVLDSSGQNFGYSELHGHSNYYTLNYLETEDPVRLG